MPPLDKKSEIDPQESLINKESLMNTLKNMDKDDFEGSKKIDTMAALVGLIGLQIGAIAKELHYLNQQISKVNSIMVKFNKDLNKWQKK